MTRAIAMLVVLAAAAAHGDTPSTRERASYITSLLDTLATTDGPLRTAMSNYIYTVDRNKCQAPVESLHVGCLRAATQRYCQAHFRDVARCTRLADVIVTNRLSEPWFVPTDVRYALMEKHRDYRAALERELRQHHAIVVTELAMSRHFPGSGASNAALATGIEAFCREQASLRDMSWQYCVAAIVWFIASEGGEGAR